MTVPAQPTRPCMHCGALAGAPCLTAAGTVMQATHYARDDDAPFLEALYEDIRAARPGSSEFYELIRLAKRMVREGASGE